MSPGWQSRTVHRASRVEKRMAFALPVLRMEILAGVIPTFWASSPEDIFLRASITSRLMIIILFRLLFRLLALGLAAKVVRQLHTG